MGCCDSISWTHAMMSSININVTPGSQAPCLRSCVCRSINRVLIIA